MAVDNRPFKSKEQDGQGNEVIIRDQQLVEQGTTTTMPAGTYFQTLDVDGRPVKIPKDNMLNLIVEGLGIIFNGQSDQQTVTKVPTLNGNNFGASTVATLASVLGVFKTSSWGEWLTDINISKPQGFYSFQSSATGVPSGFSGVGALVSFSQGIGGTGTYGIEFAYGLNNNTLYFRYKTNYNWSTRTWTKVTCEPIEE